MIPFGGFMQASAGSVPVFGDKTVNNNKNIQGLPENDKAILLSDDAAGSFLAWVQTLMDGDATVETDGERVFDLENSDHESDLPALDQVPTLIADARDQTPAGQHVSQTLNGACLDDGSAPFPAGIVNSGMTRNGGCQSADNHAHKALGVVQEMIVAKENPSAVEQTQTSAGDQPHQTNVSGLATPTGPGDDKQIKENPLPLDARENTSPEGFEKEKTRSALKPVAPAGAEGKTNSNRFIQERLPSELGISEKAIQPAPPQQHFVTGQTRDPESIVAALTDDKTASSEEDTANSQGKNKHSQAQRIASADANENQSQKSQSSDSVKSTVPELTQSHPSFQDSAKAMAADPSTNMVLKQTAGPAAALSRTEEPAAKTFQTTVMDQIVDKAALRSIHGRTEIRISLKPEFLGNVQMNIATDKEQLVVRIVTDQPVVKEIIETHLHHLKTELHNQGLTIDKFEVMVNPDAGQQPSREQFAQMFKNNSSQNGRQPPREQNPETGNRSDNSESDGDPPDRDGVNYFA